MKKHHMFCVEAMPNTAKILEETARDMKMDDSFHIVNAAGSGKDGVIKFPNVGYGLEAGSIGHCSDPENFANAMMKDEYVKSCVDVPSYTIDTLLTKIVKPVTTGLLSPTDDEAEEIIIDLLAVDAEGYDFEIMKASKYALSRARYLEFEYNNIAPWTLTNMSTAVEYLEKEHGYICYVAGAQRLWRLTGCALEFQNEHFTWSNVACVNTRLDDGDTGFQAALIQEMEQLFKETLTLPVPPLRSIDWNPMIDSSHK